MFHLVRKCFQISENNFVINVVHKQLEKINPNKTDILDNVPARYPKEAEIEC